MANDPLVTIRFEADDKGLDKSFKEIKKKAETQGESIGESFSGAFSKLGISFGTLAKGAGIIGVATMAYKGLTNVFETGLREAQATEDAINSLNTALRNTGQFTNRTSDELIRYAQSLSDITTFGDDAIISTSSLIQSLGALDQQGLKRATKAALDLSAALGIDLNSAAQLVGKAASGEVGSFSRYGLAIEKGKTATETFENVLVKLESRFGGAAASKVNTFSGSIAQLGIAFGDLSKAVVGYITNSDLIQGAIRLTTSLVKATTNLINPDKGTIEQQISATITKLEELRAKQEQYSRLARIDALGFKNDSQKNLEATQKEISALTSKLEILRLQSREGGTLSSQVVQTVAPISQEELDRIYENGKLIGLTQEQVALENYAKNQELIATLRENDLISEMAFNERSLELERQYQEQLNQIKQKGRDKQSEADKKAAQLSATLAGQVSQTMAKAVSFGVESMVKSFVLGEKSGENFLKSMLGMLGDLSTQMGQTLILAGIGIQSLFSLSGASAIAAGAGLVALGTILKSFAGGKEGPSTGDGGSAFATQQATTGSIVDQQERAEPETKVVINVQGSVLSSDSDELGLRLANILKEASLNNNVKASVFA